MTSHDVRPARQRDLALFEAEEHADGTGFAMVAGDPPTALVRVRLLDGHAHVERLVVGADLDGSVRTALVEAVCERLAVRGGGQVTVAPFAGAEEATYAALGFVAVPADQPVPGPLVAVREEAGRVLMRRVLRQHRTPEELAGGRAPAPVLARWSSCARGSDRRHSRGPVDSCEDSAHD